MLYVCLLCTVVPVRGGDRPFTVRDLLQTLNAKSIRLILITTCRFHKRVPKKATYSDA